MLDRCAIEVLTEHWGWRSGSLDRRWTRFERYAAREGAAALADELLALRGARAPDVAGRLAVAPWWLRRRVRAAFEARRTVGEEVTRYENARDQLIAFAHLWRRRGLPEQAWTVPVTAGTPAEAVQRLRMLLDGAPFRPE